MGHLSIIVILFLCFASITASERRRSCGSDGIKARDNVPITRESCREFREQGETADWIFQDAPEDPQELLEFCCTYDCNDLNYLEFGCNYMRLLSRRRRGFFFYG
ncbi:hypothetical protein PRIPAC_76428 [Pristionchus pacificus]|uniref:Uncharacterized protein n=1 Tax=Pristionchus pacificus TaxID=54126 RepID=A0A2A6CSD4_PRIPA|nr:hypothetical protein PRIPAC_76428 [Pristionchus pacificus]|eukprot:PDM81049.1 hypothetical protein PRIPAC_36052 [Pristionchus pacificus]